MVNDFLKKLIPWLPVVVVAAYFVFLGASWNKYLAFQQQVRADMDAKLDEYLKLPRDNGQPG